MLYRDFNSIKVQLEHPQNHVSRNILQFQFHKGTIRTEHRKRNMNQRQYFNSIKVQLEHLSHRHMFTAQVFQFHKGTIRTGNGE